jgi:hypothetical protein
MEDVPSVFAFGLIAQGVASVDTAIREDVLIHADARPRQGASKVFL